MRNKTEPKFGGRHDAHHKHHHDHHGDHRGGHDHHDHHDHSGGGGHPHHHGRRGGGGRARRGESKFLLMDALLDSPKHGYEIIKSLEERSGGQYVPSPGVVYPNLQFLLEVGLVRAEQDGDRRVFHLTDAGRVEIDAHTDEVSEFWAQFAPPTAADARAEVSFVEEELGYLERTVRGGLRGDPSAELVRGVRQAIENCRNDVRRLITTATAASEE